MTSQIHIAYADHTTLPDIIGLSSVNGTSCVVI